ncbi:MAG: DEAD/DEAH box helicase family protein [Synergistaceae bacterium]|nr:DEAD/DEAH box helicase family protein [Synergistaceae bacterium]
MLFKFTEQEYQTKAVDSVIKVFEGQNYKYYFTYRRDVSEQETGEIFKNDDLLYTGYGNHGVSLSDYDLLRNIRRVQTGNNIKLSDSVNNEIGSCVLDIEMETGTGKTYTYIKTMFELNKKFGWKKFIVIVPSIAIREGVKKSFDITQSHFMELYGTIAKTFVYDSNKLHEIDFYSQDSGINVMIINIQAFNANFDSKEGSKNYRIINSERDDFGSRKPIDIIAANRPIIILDEPQKMGGAKTLAGIKKFKPLFALNYSATHKQHHNLIYVLDAYDAFINKLVKKIEVKCFDVKNLPGTHSYMYLSDIIISPSKAPEARLEFERGNKRITRIIKAGDDLYKLSGEMSQYNGFIVSDIDPRENAVTFTNMAKIRVGEAAGDVSESYLRRLQIRETIRAHFEKEKNLFTQNIKCLSLFFIDEVSKYRKYDSEGCETNSEYGEIFESEYNSLLNEYINLDTPYSEYLRNIDVKRTHAGYFSIDKHGRKVNSTVKRGNDSSDDISAYDLILRDKERLLSLNEPVRFIFSHSALREGWDNPNIFQICTLRHGGDSPIRKRQEVGRGLRLCVNQDGARMDLNFLSDKIFDINKLTVIASDGYNDFVAGLQRGIIEDLYNRPTKADIEYFTGKKFISGGKEIIISEIDARKIHNYLIKNDYIDFEDNITQKYHDDSDNNNLAELPAGINAGVHKIIRAIFDSSLIREMIDDGRAAKILENPLNKNFFREEFQRLWSLINHKYSYRAEFDSCELIKKSITAINKELSISQAFITITTGIQENFSDFGQEKTRTEKIKLSGISSAKYDFIGEIARDTKLTRRSVADILKGIDSEKFKMFALNPEEFIKQVTHLINTQRAGIIIQQVTYNMTSESYDSSVFTMGKNGTDLNFTHALESKKNVQPYAILDSKVEKDMREELERSEEVCVYAKLPRSFTIPTPMGNYSPDWAIVYNDRDENKREIYFIAETKGSLESVILRPIEYAKIECAKKLFARLSSQNVIYKEVRNLDDLISILHK